MASLNRASFNNQLVPLLNAVLGLNYKSIDDEHTPLFDIETSDRAFEEEQMMTGFETAPDKDEGSGVSYDFAQETYKSRYQHVTVALAFSITEEALEDNLYDTVAKIRAKALGRAMANAKQIKAANIFNNGFSAAAADTGGDGVCLFSAAHPTLSAGNQSNTVSTDMSETALENALITISQLKDERGVLLSAMAQSLHIPPQLMFVAERILRSPGQAGNANNDLNAMKSMGVFPKGWFVNHRFTDTNAWFIRTDVPDGTKMFKRVGLSTKTDGDFDTGNVRYKARERYSFRWSDWRQWYGSAGSS